MNSHEHDLREAICHVGRLMYEKGLVVASDGNISARLDEGRLLITPSGLSKGMLEPEQLLIVDLDGRPVGPRTAANRRLKPTSELPMHLEAFRQRPDIAAVVHAHPPIAVALSIAGIAMADCLLPEVIVFLGIVPTTPRYATPSSSENARAIRELIRNHDAIVLQRHGSLTVGNSVMQAFMRTETVEQNARIGFMLAQLGVHNPLPAPEVQKLLAQRRQMGLTRPGESDAFCDVCGVCHDAPEHVQTMRSKLYRQQNGPLPPLPADPSEIRALVADIVRKTVGS